MIKLEKAEVFNFEGAIRGMRNPMNSWDKSDSGSCSDFKLCEGCPEDIAAGCGINEKFDAYMWDGYVIGPNDLKLMKNLIKAGPEHRKFLRQIFVSVDITAPLYWWKEFDTYKIGTVADSCSTMHKIHAKEFEISDFSCEHLMEVNEVTLRYLIKALNWNRDMFLKTKDKKYWWQMIQLLPTSYNQKRTVTLNYEVLMSMYHQRKNHKLDEWRTFCEWIGSLPYAKELIINKTERIYRNEAQRNV